MRGMLGLVLLFAALGTFAQDPAAPPEPLTKERKREGIVVAAFGPAVTVIQADGPDSAVYGHFGRLFGGSEKGEFETTAQHQQRLDRLKYPRYFAVDVRPKKLTYNADAKELLIQSFGRVDFNTSEVSVRLKADLKVSTYVASNAYGAKATVKKTRGTVYEFRGARPWSDVPLSPHFDWNPGTDEAMASLVLQEIPASQAKALKAAPPRVRFVFELTNVTVGTFDTDEWEHEPEIDVPTDTKVTTRSINGKFIGAVVYDPRSKKALGSMVWGEHADPFLCGAAQIKELCPTPE
jgi:hypothetical protein